MVGSFLNSIAIEDIKIGMSASYSQTITDADIKAFAAISGDRNPVHLDEVYAKSSRFKGRISHGMMSASFFSAIFGTKIPGEGCVYTYQSLNFKKPVYVNDTVTAIVEVIGVDTVNRRIKFKTICKVKDSIVTDGEAEIYVPFEFKKLLINDKNELIKFKAQIFNLFKDSFGKNFDEDLWRWAYIDNPNGEPIVSLYFDKDKLIGHYAVIPVKFRYKNQSVKVVLSMTTMVDSKYRKYGIFTEQATEIYAKATEIGYKLVYGFPNKKSAPGFKKRLGWKLENLLIKKLKHDEILKIGLNNSYDAMSFDMDDEINLKWRLSKPGQEYFMDGKNILKEFGNECDVVFWENEFSSLSKDKLYNLLFEKLDLIANSDIEYCFGYKLFDDSFSGINFKKDLIMSDVF